MPERFGLACFLERLRVNSPQPVIDATATLLSDHLGQAVELTVLDYGTGAQVSRPWCPADQAVCTWPGPREILFVYFVGSNARGPCISFVGRAAAAELTVSMANMAFASCPDEVADLCMRLHAACSTFAAEALIAAGGEFGFSEGLLTVQQALTEATAPLSLAQWIAYRNEGGSAVQRFVEVRRSPTTILIRAAQNLAA